VSTQRFVNAFKKQVSSRSSLIGKSRQDAFGQSLAAGRAHPELRRWTQDPSILAAGTHAHNRFDAESEHENLKDRHPRHRRGL
jgi:hypothetical protein